MLNFQKLIPNLSHHHHYHSILLPLITVTATSLFFLVLFLRRRMHTTSSIIFPTGDDNKPLHRFSYSLFRRATNSFSFSLGHGGFDTVFSGTLPWRLRYCLLRHAPCSGSSKNSYCSDSAVARVYSMVEITEFIFAMRPLNAQPLRSNNAALHTKSPPPHPATNRIPFRSDLRSNPTFSPTATTSSHSFLSPIAPFPSPSFSPTTTPESSSSSPTRWLMPRCARLWQRLGEEGAVKFVRIVLAANEMLESVREALRNGRFGLAAERLKELKVALNIIENV
ncbi:hypothetical protein HN873_056359 [Arachis hypogaea]|nr:uncharacterized protein DS421_16g550020 [Arachis hypogaea]